MAVMAKLKNNKQKLSYISVPSQIIHSLSSSSLQSLLLSPKKPSRNANWFFNTSRRPRFWLSVLFLFSLFGMLRLGFNLDPLLPFSHNPCLIGQVQTLFPKKEPVVQMGLGANGENAGVEAEDGEETEFWKQPDGLGYRPCLDFSDEYLRSSEAIVQNRRRYMMVVVSGGVNQQRNQIVDAVVIARILGAALVVPILQVNVIWGDER
uniref:O-fucosyltransferase family protein n=1 Tax=Nelumbo nucifera TaxID=4432 RepID=A0A822YCV2_NELNU|nr:TPA_asm: hypothetical protein HUJ06_031421 [Nelumbo nucifera]